MKARTNILIAILLSLAFTAQAVSLLSLPEVPNNLFEKPSFISRIVSSVKECKLNIFCYFRSKLGSTITTINATDLISASRATINTNFNNLNITKLENASSTGYLNFGYLTASSTTASSTFQSINIYGNLAIGGLGTTTIRGLGATSTFPSNLATFGNIVVGGSATTTIRGDNATSTLANGLTLTNGCFIDISGSCVQGVNVGNNYDWTGSHTWSKTATTSSLRTTSNVGIASSSPSGLLTVEGTTTVANLIVASSTVSINNQVYKFPPSQVASSSLVTDGNGGLTWGGPLISTGATSTVPGAIFNMVITHGLNRTPSLIKISSNSVCDANSTTLEIACWSVGTATSTLSQFVLTQSAGCTADLCTTFQTIATTVDSKIINLYDELGNAEFVANLSAVTTTTFTLNISTNISTDTSGTRYVLWEAY